MDPVFGLGFVGLLCCLANICYGNSGFVSAIMWQVVWQIASSWGFELADNNIPLATGLILTSKLFTVVVVLLFVRKHINIRLTALLGIPSACTSLIGIELLLWMGPISQRRLLGVVLFIAFGTLLVKKKYGWRVENHPWNPATIKQLLRLSGVIELSFVSIFSGIGMGLFAISGPPIILWKTKNAVPKELCRSNVLAGELIQLPVTLYYLLQIKHVFTEDDAQYYIVVTASGLVGIYCGFILSDYVTRRYLTNIVLGLILLVACLSCTASLKSLVLRIILATIIFIPSCVCWLFVSLQVRKRDELSFFELEQMIPETVVADACGDEWEVREPSLSFTEEDTQKLISHEN